ncbi:pif-2 [Venturia canescens]|uniref:Pif-2 n=1 Tax=Venturia canescens TaxID=32260 RepID=A0ACB9ZKP6_9HYME|nr:uncharacterized protein LOC122409809 [Venturia canescens]KAI5630602.1 pif-2 [Venturia canescens]
MEWRMFLLVLLSSLALILLIYLLYYYSFEPKIAEDNKRMAEELRDTDLSSLLNGSSINNIPQLNLITTNAVVALANKCGKGPVFIGSKDATDSECIKTCLSSTAKVLNVRDDHTFYYSVILKRGAHCIIGPRPECNMRMTRALMTINSVTCRSRFPSLVGGPLGTQVVACNNLVINDPKNVLWDYKYDTQFDPDLTILDHEDERLPDGSYRFRCKFRGKDARNNFYVQHPNNRFHPFKNYCTANAYGTLDEMGAIISDDKRSFVCDCGNPERTRMYNMFPNDPKSQCSPHTLKAGPAEKKDPGHEMNTKQILSVPYKCFTTKSPIDDIANYMPCPRDKIKGNTVLQKVELQFTEDKDSLIEHPFYNDMLPEKFEYISLFGTKATKLTPYGTKLKYNSNVF